MKFRILVLIAIVLVSWSATPDRAVAQEPIAGAGASELQSFLVCVNEYEVSGAVDTDASAKKLLEMVAGSGKRDDVSHVRTCAVSVIYGVPTHAVFSKQLSRLNSTSQGRTGSVIRSYEDISIGTSINILATERGSDVKIDLKYDSTTLKDSEADDVPGTVVNANVESTFIMSQGEVSLCGILTEGATRVITIQLKR